MLLDSITSGLQNKPSCCHWQVHSCHHHHDHGQPTCQLILTGLTMDQLMLPLIHSFTNPLQASLRFTTMILARSTIYTQLLPLPILTKEPHITLFFIQLCIYSENWSMHTVLILTLAYSFLCNHTLIITTGVRRVQERKCI